jgi:hypothetical protein
MWLFSFLLLASSPTVPEPLRLSLATGKAAYRAGEPVEMTLSVTNTSGQAVELHFDTSQRYDFAIHDAAEREVWNWAQEQIFAQVLGREEIAPGATRVFKEKFLGTLPAGAYRVTARLTAREAPLAASTRFSVE